MGLGVHVLFVDWESVLKACRNPAKTELNLSLGAVEGDRGKSVVKVNGVG